MIDEEYYKGYYHFHATRFDSSRLWLADEISKTVELIDRLFPPQSRLLEIGCGSFQHGHILSESGHSVVGVDLSLAQLKQASKGWPLICANATSLPIRQGAFNGVVCIMMIHQIAESERKRTLRNMREVLGPSGRIIIKTCSHDDVRRRPLGKWFPSSVEINLRRFPDTPTLTRLLDSVGFVGTEIIKSTGASTFEAAALMRNLESRPSSSLRLVPDEEYEIGLRIFKADHAKHKTIDLLHFHTYFVASAANDRMAARSARSDLFESRTEVDDDWARSNAR